jgi:cytochrome c oxidase subunit IV
MAKKHSSAGRYVVVWIVLIALTLTSFLLSLAHLGEADFLIALVIAVVKSTLVLLFFMHLVEARASNVFVPVLAASMVGMLLALMVSDVLTRHTFPPAPLPALSSP